MKHILSRALRWYCKTASLVYNTETGKNDTHR